MLQGAPALPQNRQKEVGKVIVTSRSRIRPFSIQPRQFFNPVTLSELAEGIKEVGQLVPVFVRELDDSDPPFDYELIDGQRRWHACDIAGVPTMKVIVMPVKDTAEQFLMSIVANFGRDDHSPLEIANAIKFFQQNQGKTIKQIASIFARSENWVSQYMKLLKLTDRVQAMLSSEAAENRRLNLSKALILSDLPRDKQDEMAEVIVSSDMKTSQARNIVRQRAEKMGIKIGNPDRTPNKDYHVLRCFAGRIARELEMFLGMPFTFFSAMFQHRIAEDNEKLIAKLEESIDRLQLLVKTLKRLRQK